MTLDLSRLHFPVTTLGPGRRVGVWFQGCSIRCPGCVSLDTWVPGRGATTVDEVFATIRSWLIEADGVTVSGGEPFDQPMALLALLRRIRRATDADVLVFSGYSIERLTPALDRMTGLIDALVTDPYDARAPQTLVLRGSDNQRLHLLTPRGRARFSQYDRRLEPTDNVLDVMFDDDGTAWLAGIPRRNDMRRLESVLAAAGHESKTSQTAR
jgi:anaerobic ribonucleoside-triphosphate reductase activating protein